MNLYKNEINIKPALHEKSPLGDLGVKQHFTSIARKVPPGGFRGKTAFYQH